jgi:hypothetical protein
MLNSLQDMKMVQNMLINNHNIAHKQNEGQEPNNHCNKHRKRL